MGMKMKITEYGAPAHQILAISDHYIALAFRHAKAIAGTPGLAVLVDSRYVVRAGTVFPANDATAIGLVLNDYDVHDGDAQMAVVIHGFIRTSALPVMPVAAALTAMKMLSFNPLINLVVALSGATVAIAALEAINTVHTIVLTIANATFRDEAATLANWTIAGEAVNKVAVTSIVVSADKTQVTITTTNSAAAANGATTVFPKAIAISTGQVPAAAFTIATVA